MAGKISNKNEEEDFSKHPIFIAIQKHDDAAVMRMLEENPKLLTMATKDGWTPVHEAIRHWRQKIVFPIREMLEKTDPHVDDIYTLIERGDKEGVADLVARDHHVLTHKGDTPLDRAAKVGDLAMVKLVGGLYQQHNMGLPKTPPVFAAQRDNVSILKYLVEDLGLSINAKYGSDRKATSALEEAFEAKHDDVLLYMVSSPKLNMRTRVNSPLSMAILANKPDVVAKILERKDVTVGHRATALNRALSADNKAIYQVILDYPAIKCRTLRKMGIDIKSDDQVDKKFAEFMQQLIDKGAIKRADIPNDKKQTSEAINRFDDFADVVVASHVIAKNAIARHTWQFGIDYYYEDKEHEEQTEQMTVNLLKNANHDWQKTAAQLRAFNLQSAGDINDTAREFVQYGLLPEFIRVAGGGNDLTKIEPTKFISEMVPDVLVTMSENKGPLELLSTDERWHARRADMIGQMIDFNIPTHFDKWYGILPGKEIEVPEDIAGKGVRIVNLTTGNELREESRRLSKEIHYCIDGYAPQCSERDRDGKYSHIFSIRSGTGENEKSLSSIEAKFDGNGQMYIVQHRSEDNTEPNTKIKQAAEWFVEQVNKEREKEGTGIKLNTARQGHVQIDGLHEVPPVIFDVGIIPDSEAKTTERFSYFKRPELRNLVLDDEGKPIKDEEASEARGVTVYKQKHRGYFLPRRYRNGSVQDYLQDTGLLEKGLKILEKQDLVFDAEYPEPLTRQDTHMLRLAVERLQQQYAKEAPDQPLIGRR